MRGYIWGCIFGMWGYMAPAKGVRPIQKTRRYPTPPKPARTKICLGGRFPACASQTFDPPPPPCPCAPNAPHRCPEMCFGFRILDPIPSPPCIFAWEQWEQWEHRINRGFPRSHSIFCSGNSGNKNRGVGLIPHISGRQIPRSPQKPEPRTFNTEKTPMHHLVHFLDFAARRGFTPRPPTGGPAGQGLA